MQVLENLGQPVRSEESASAVGTRIAHALKKVCPYIFEVDAQSVTIPYSVHFTNPNAHKLLTIST